MDEGNEQQKPRKTNWTATDQAVRQDRSVAFNGEPPVQPIGSTELVAAGNPNVLAAVNVAPSVEEDRLGILGKWKANRIGRKSAMESIQLHYASELDILAHRLSKAAQVKKAHTDVLAEEYLKELDSKHLAVLSEFGLRNKETRERALIELTDATAAKLREVQEKDWPEELIHDTIVQLFALRKRVVAEMMKELGEDYQDA